MNEKICGLIPVYNNHMTIAKVAQALLKKVDFIIVVDDGSNDGTETIVDRLKRENPTRVEVVNHSENRGKGAAVQSGLHHAEVSGVHACNTG